MFSLKGNLPGMNGTGQTEKAAGHGENVLQVPYLLRQNWLRVNPI